MSSHLAVAPFKMQKKPTVPLNLDEALDRMLLSDILIIFSSAQRCTNNSMVYIYSKSNYKTNTPTGAQMGVSFSLVTFRMWVLSLKITTPLVGVGTVAINKQNN